MPSFALGLAVGKACTARLVARALTGARGQKRARRWARRKGNGYEQIDLGPDPEPDRDQTSQTDPLGTGETKEGLVRQASGLSSKSKSENKQCCRGCVKRELVPRPVY